MLAARSAALECFIRFLNSPQASLWLQHRPGMFYSIFELPTSKFVASGSFGHFYSSFWGSHIKHRPKNFSIFGVPATEAFFNLAPTSIQCDGMQHHPQFIFQFLEFPRAGTPQMFSVIFNSAPARSAAPKILFDFGVLATDMFSVISNPTPASIGPPRRIAPAPKFYYIFGVPAIEFSLPNFLAEVFSIPQPRTSLRSTHWHAVPLEIIFQFFEVPASGHLARRVGVPLIELSSTVEATAPVIDVAVEFFAFPRAR
ncbi:hypothetical protein K438DRAFT_1750106 [Mycena galopus ATCC 62051]|nr:hypothetical protein K438DRAFT_1750106 [Mycena galopus ATCC 62051]